MKRAITEASELVFYYGGLITELEAKTILDYFDGHGYRLEADEYGSMYRLDVNEPDGEEKLYSPADIIDFCVEQNANMIDETDRGCSDEDYILELKKDEQILNDAFKKIRAAGAPEKCDERLRKFDVRIVEKLEKTVTVEARDACEAEEIVEDRWNKSEWVLTADDFVEAEFCAVQK